ncbi:MAG: hypothetical protein ACYCWW_13515 [Deltaproteobacteria bacterium]
MELRRIVILVGMCLALGATLAWMQSKFDQGDLHRARELLGETRPSPTTPSLEQALAAKLGHPAQCDATITSGCRGIVQLRCAGGALGDFLFDADLAERPPILHPANPNAQALMIELARSAGLDVRAHGDRLPMVKLDGGR